MTWKQKVPYIIISLIIAIALFCYARCDTAKKGHSRQNHDTMDECNNSLKQGCPVEPIATHNLYTLDAKKPKRLLGQVEVGECFLRIRKDNADTLVVSFHGHANEEEDWLMFSTGLTRAKTLTLPNVFYKGECFLSYVYRIGAEVDLSHGDISCKK